MSANTTLERPGSLQGLWAGHGRFVHEPPDEAIQAVDEPTAQLEGKPLESVHKETFLV
jgi:hypothetical protein